MHTSIVSFKIRVQRQDFIWSKVQFLIMTPFKFWKNEIVFFNEPFHSHPNLKIEKLDRNEIKITRAYMFGWEVDKRNCHLLKRFKYVPTAVIAILPWILLRLRTFRMMHNSSLYNYHWHALEAIMMQAQLRWSFFRTALY